jgi:hypothetical protein
MIIGIVIGFVAFLVGIIVASAFPFHLSFLIHRKNSPMPVIPSFQSVIDELNSVATAVTALKAQADAATGAPSAQDVADTQAALQGAADAVKAAAGQ